MVAKGEFGAVLKRMIPDERLAAVCARHAPLPRTPPKLSAVQVVESLVYHQLQPAGPLGQHAAELHGVQMSESAHSQRRVASLPSSAVLSRRGIKGFSSWRRFSGSPSFSLRPYAASTGETHFG